MCKWVAIPSLLCVPLASEQATWVQIVVCEVMGVRLVALCGDQRGDLKTALARQMAMYVCHLTLAMSIGEIAVAFGRDRSTVRHAIRRVEAARQDAEFDRTLGELQQSVRAGGGHV